jgi:hypothetical protein
MLFDLEPIGDPDDGMIAVYTGCVDGNGKRKIAVIDITKAKTGDYMAALRAYNEWVEVCGCQVPPTIPHSFIIWCEQRLLKRNKHG